METISSSDRSHSIGGPRQGPPLDPAFQTPPPDINLTLPPPARHLRGEGFNSRIPVNNIGQGPSQSSCAEGAPAIAQADPAGAGKLPQWDLMAEPELDHPDEQQGDKDSQSGHFAGGGASFRDQGEGSGYAETSMQLLTSLGGGSAMAMHWDLMLDPIPEQQHFPQEEGEGEPAAGASSAAGVGVHWDLMMEPAETVSVSPVAQQPATEGSAAKGLIGGPAEEAVRDGGLGSHPLVLWDLMPDPELQGQGGGMEKGQRKAKQRQGQRQVEGEAFLGQGLPFNLGLLCEDPVPSPGTGGPAGVLIAAKKLLRQEEAAWLQGDLLSFSAHALLGDSPDLGAQGVPYVPHCADKSGLDSRETGLFPPSQGIPQSSSGGTPRVREEPSSPLLASPASTGFSREDRPSTAAQTSNARAYKAPRVHDGPALVDPGSDVATGTSGRDLTLLGSTSQDRQEPTSEVSAGDGADNNDFRPAGDLGKARGRQPLGDVNDAAQVQRICLDLSPGSEWVEEQADPTTSPLRVEGASLHASLPNTCSSNTEPGRAPAGRPSDSVQHRGAMLQLQGISSRSKGRRKDVRTGVCPDEPTSSPQTGPLCLDFNPTRPRQGVPDLERTPSAQEDHARVLPPMQPSLVDLNPSPFQVEWGLFLEGCSLEGPDAAPHNTLRSGPTGEPMVRQASSTRGRDALYLAAVAATSCVGGPGPHPPSSDLPVAASVTGNGSSQMAGCGGIGVAPTTQSDPRFLSTSQPQSTGPVGGIPLDTLQKANKRQSDIPGTRVEVVCSARETQTEFPSQRVRHLGMPGAASSLRTPLAGTGREPMEAQQGHQLLLGGIHPPGVSTQGDAGPRDSSDEEGGVEGPGKQAQQLAGPQEGSGQAEQGGAEAVQAVESGVAVEGGMGSLVAASNEVLAEREGPCNKDGVGNAGAMGLSEGRVTRVQCRMDQRTRRDELIWGAHFFFSHYYAPADTSPPATNAGEGGRKAQSDSFVVQHDMENAYMWAMQPRPHNALKMRQLRAFISGHARFRDLPFPYSASLGFRRSNPLQRKKYKGISNPLCILHVHCVPAPDLSLLSRDEVSRWEALTGRPLGFLLPPEAQDYTAWRPLQTADTALGASEGDARGEQGDKGQGQRGSAAPIADQEQEQAGRSDGRDDMANRGAMAPARKRQGAEESAGEQEEGEAEGGQCPSPGQDLGPQVDAGAVQLQASGASREGGESGAGLRFGLSEGALNETVMLVREQGQACATLQRESQSQCPERVGREVQCPSGVFLSPQARRQGITATQQVEATFAATRNANQAAGAGAEASAEALRNQEQWHNNIEGTSASGEQQRHSPGAQERRLVQETEAGNTMQSPSAPALGLPQEPSGDTESSTGESQDLGGDLQGGRDSTGGVEEATPDAMALQGPGSPAGMNEGGSEMGDSAERTVEASDRAGSQVSHQCGSSLLHLGWTTQGRHRGGAWRASVGRPPVVVGNGVFFGGVDRSVEERGLVEGSSIGVVGCQGLLHLGRGSEGGGSGRGGGTALPSRGEAGTLWQVQHMHPELIHRQDSEHSPAIAQGGIGSVQGMPHLTLQGPGQACGVDRPSEERYWHEGSGIPAFASAGGEGDVLGQEHHNAGTVAEQLRSRCLLLGARSPPLAHSGEGGAAATGVAQAETVGPDQQREGRKRRISHVAPSPPAKHARPADPQPCLLEQGTDSPQSAVPCGAVEGSHASGPAVTATQHQGPALCRRASEEHVVEASQRHGANSAADMDIVLEPVSGPSNQPRAHLALQPAHILLAALSSLQEQELASQLLHRDPYRPTPTAPVTLPSTVQGEGQLAAAMPLPPQAQMRLSTTSPRRQAQQVDYQTDPPTLERGMGSMQRQGVDNRQGHSQHQGTAALSPEHLAMRMGGGQHVRAAGHAPALAQQLQSEEWRGSSMDHPSPSGPAPASAQQHVMDQGTGYQSGSVTPHLQHHRTGGNSNMGYTSGTPRPSGDRHLDVVPRERIRDVAVTPERQLACYKTVYENESSFLLRISLPSVDLASVRLTWRNVGPHGIVKVSGRTRPQSCTQGSIHAQGTLFRLSDPSAEHPAPGTFTREVALPQRISEGRSSANAFPWPDGHGLEVVIPKEHQVTEEREIMLLMPSAGSGSHGVCL